MKQPTLEEVKEYFNNAKEVIPVEDETEKVDITNNIENEIHYWCNSYWIDIEGYSGKSVLLWDGDTGRYAEIITYKEKTFSITESQINELKESLSLFGMKERLKEWFPESEEFESEVKSLPKDFTGWAKTKGIGNEKWLNYFEQGVIKYGFDSNGIWQVLEKGEIQNHDYEATEQEVFEALKNEAVKRGFKEDDIITDIYYSGSVTLNSNGFKLKTENELWLGDCVIFYNGVWAEKTITLSEAEQQLGKKIIV